MEKGTKLYCPFYRSKQNRWVVHEVEYLDIVDLPDLGLKVIIRDDGVVRAVENLDGYTTDKLLAEQWRDQRVNVTFRKPTFSHFGEVVYFIRRDIKIKHGIELGARTPDIKIIELTLKDMVWCESEEGRRYLYGYTFTDADGTEYTLDKYSLRWCYDDREVAEWKAREWINKQ